MTGAGSLHCAPSPPRARVVAILRAFLRASPSDRQPHWCHLFPDAMNFQLSGMDWVGLCRDK